MIPSTTVNTIAPAPGRMALVALTIAVLTVAFYGIEHRNTQAASLEVSTGEELAERTAEGDSSRRLLIPAIALLGVIMLLRRDGFRLEVRSPLAWLLLGYVTWCGLSILWSDDPRLTFRHFAVLLFCGVGALGIARQVNLRELCLIALVISTIFVAIGVQTEIAQGTFRPFSLDYRFAGTLHPNGQATYCATMALAAAFLASHAKRGRTLLWSLCAAAVVLLVLTKSRTVCGAFLAALVIGGWSTVSWPKKLIAATVAISLGCIVTLAVTLLDSDLGQQVTNVALIGRQEEADSLSGRFPLWAAIMPHTQDHFLLGHGYLTFWNPQHIETLSRLFDWGIPDGHCAYLDTILDLGAIGAALCVATVLAGIGTVRRRFLAHGDYGYGFFFALLVCRALNAMLESGFLVPTSFPPFLMVCGLLHLAFCRQTDQSPSSEDISKEADQ